MKFKLYREYGALNSSTVFDAFSAGIKKIGHTIVADNEDVAVIWSVLWKGRMRNNQAVYEIAKKIKKPVIIIEVGNLSRGNTWRVCLDNINGLGEFANQLDLDLNRPNKLGVDLKIELKNRKPHILICTQEQMSLQWVNMPAMETWVKETVSAIKQVSDRPIVVRPHPRHRLIIDPIDFSLEIPKKISSTYDNFDIDYNCHCVINHNSGPAVQAAIFGIPVICDTSSLAWPVSDKLHNLENISLPDRQEWFIKLCHTEWTVEEIACGLPITRLMPKLIERLDLQKK
jgi:hypothetical protein